MSFRILRTALMGIAAALGCGFSVQAQSSYLFWRAPTFGGSPVHGDEAGLGEALPGATPAELRANLLWNMRAGLNVAALQCQFSPALMTVRNYNNLLSQHSAELNAAYTTLTGYFRRTAGKTWQTQFDQFSTRTYNGFSTLHAVLGFCETAASIGRETLVRKRGELYRTAEERMREFRNSLVPAYDGLYGMRVYVTPPPAPQMNDQCWDRKNQFRWDRCTMPAEWVTPAA